MKRSLDDTRMKPGGPQPPEGPYFDEGAGGPIDPFPKPKLQAGWAGYGVMIICLILFGYLMSGCISLKSPTTQILTKTAAFLAGYEIGKDNPELAGEFIHYTQADRADILTFYDSWKRYLAYRLGTDAVNRKLIENMLEAVEIEFVFKAPDEKIAIIRGLFMEFVEGLEAGIQANK